MNKLIVIGDKRIGSIEFKGIEGGFGEGKKAMLVKDIARIHNQQLGEINRRINDNRKRFKTGVDISDLKLNGLDPSTFENLGFNKQSVANSNNIYLLSERGYSKLLKLLEDDKAWEIYDELVDSYFDMRQEITAKAIDTSNLSPELQFMNTVVQALVNQELETKEVKTRIDNISNLVRMNTTDWRKNAVKVLRSIAIKRGGLDQFKEVANESYQMLEKRGKCDLDIRLNNRKKNMIVQGIGKTKVAKLNKMDVIAEDQRLIEIYLSVIKDMAIRYQVDFKEELSKISM